ncbi:MAG: DEAD/DEAH box helicase [Candidatus ainarchaeum sp.]|nr:DEAD/DEAH box helicase [Candidatus ainarchaeum sp.]
MNFNELNINDNIKKALEKKGFARPSEIQEKAIPAALAGKDIVGKSKTGTGKTAAFAIPLIEKILPGQGFSALVVVPTRELAMQVKEEIASIAIGSHVKSMAVFGGQSINRQLDLLERNPEIIVGTPGRLLDLMSRNAISFRSARFLILDEADKMFDMGFRDDVEKIISSLPRARQTMLFSATMPQEILHLIERNMKHDKIVFDLSMDNAPVQEVEQFYVMVDNRQKIDALQRLLKAENSKVLVFCRTKRTVDWLERQLYRRGIRALAIHGDKPQNARNRIIENYKNSRDGILIATDIVARGIHVDDIGSVVNFDFPQETETYLHRIGRTARQGRKGKAISFCSNVMELDNLERTGTRSNSIIQQLQ